MVEKHPELFPLSDLPGPPPATSPAPSISGEENHNQTEVGDLTEESEKFLQDLKTVIEEEVLEREMLDSVSQVGDVGRFFFQYF